MKLLGVKNHESQKLEKIPNTGDFLKIPENIRDFGARDFFSTFKSQFPSFWDYREFTLGFFSEFSIYPESKIPIPFNPQF